MLKLKNQENEHHAFSSRYVESYANLAKDRIIFISEDITKDVASSLAALLIYYDIKSNKEDINIFINTDGGDASALANIYDIMKLVKSPIKTICIGRAYSAGALILAAGTKGKRFITKNSSVMIHGLQCEFPGFNEDQKGSQIYFDFLNSFNRTLLEILSKQTGKSYKKIYEDCKKDNFLDASQALEYGIVDKII